MGSPNGFMLQPPTMMDSFSSYSTPVNGPGLNMSNVNPYTFGQFDTANSPAFAQLPTSVPTINPAVVPAASGAPSIWDSFLQQKDANGATSGGYGQAGLGLIQGLGGLYLGMQQYNLAKDSLAFQKDSFNKDYTARVQDYNTKLEDRQAARVASNPGYESVGSYMDKNRIR